MTCENVRDHIVAFLDGEVPPDVHAEVSEHLAVCPQCREEADSLRAASQLVRSLAPIQPSETWDLSLQRKLMAHRCQELTDELIRVRRIADELSARLAALEQAEMDARAEHDLMTVEELAAYLRITPQKVYQMLDDLPHIDLNYEVRFRRSSVDQWLKLREVRPANDPFTWSNWISGSHPSLSS